LLDVLPEDGVEAPGHAEEQDQEQQDPDAQALALELYGFGHPAEEVCKVCDLAVVTSGQLGIDGREGHLVGGAASVALQHFGGDLGEALDRKSTRLNSSHVKI